MFSECPSMVLDAAERLEVCIVNLPSSPALADAHA
jgi:hypothetical protein